MPPTGKFRKLEWKPLFNNLIRVPVLKSYWQKTSQRGESGLIFKPSDYESKTPTEARRMAYEDAQNHAKFYRELINKELLPPGTKAKAKRMKHSDAYHVEITMPKVPISYYDELRRIQSKDTYRRGDEDSIKHIVFNIARNIKRVAKKFGYAYEHYNLTTKGYDRNERGEFSTDLEFEGNYHFSKSRKGYYIDTEILANKLPFHGRIKSLLDKMSERNKVEMEEVEAKNSGLEQKLSAIVGIVGLLGSLFFTSSAFTGNVVGTLNQNSINIIGVVLFLIGVIGAFFYIRK